jgi:hypothetical protein
MEQHYYDWPDFAPYFLEDGYLFELIEAADRLEFIFDSVLRESHPAYHPPHPNEHYCYGKIRIIFPQARGVEWHSRTFRPNRDLDGTIDYGNIDALYRDTSGNYRINGDWGDVTITSDPPTVEFIEVR